MLSPTYNYASINCPTPIAPSLQLLLQNSTNPGLAPTNSSINQGDTSALIVKFNQNALRSDILATYGGGCFGLLWGLTLTTSGGSLNVIVSPGQANIQNIVEVPTQVFVTCPASSSRCNIWLLGNGQPTFVNTYLTAPSTSCVYLGSVTTNASAITGIDYSGVINIFGNQGFRKTGDTLAPTDTPPSTVRVATQTQFGVWDWDGNLHRQRVDPNSLQFTVNGPQFMNTQVQNSYATYTGSSLLTLTSSSPNIQRIIPTASMVVAMPVSGSALSFGQNFYVYNDAASGSGINITLKDYTQASTIATITPQTHYFAVPYNLNGAPIWPTPIHSGPF